MNKQATLVNRENIKHFVANTSTKGKITISHESIKNELSAYEGKPEKAILEYIWNGFDSGATRVNLNYSFPQSANGTDFGYPELEIIDDGTGWDFDHQNTMKIFLDSTKIKENTKSLPHGSRGVGRFTFYVFSKQVLWETIHFGKKFAFKLSADDLINYQSVDMELSISKGTKVSFSVSSDSLNQAFFENILLEAIKEEFAWFLKLFPEKKILINNNLVTIDDLIKNKKFESITIEDSNFNVEYIQWVKNLPNESSKYYFLNSHREEVSKKTTGLNYKSDVFYHSVFIQSEFFDNFQPFKSDKDNEIQLSLDKDNKKIYCDLLIKIKEILIGIRKEYLIDYSEIIIQNWEDNKVLPRVQDLMVPAEEYRDLIKEVYVALPQLFTNVGEDQRKIILRLFGSLMGTDERDYILTILEQVYELSPEDKSTLMDMLSRTDLSSMIRTIKEVDHRIQVLDSLEEILFDPSRIKTTKEVDHLQKVLDENFWIFGDEFRLFSSTEGQIKKTLERFNAEILQKEDISVATNSRKELDLFLTKYDVVGNKHTGVVIEIKRPSITLGKKQYDQMENYMLTIIKEPACNGSNMEWYFYLIGNDYDEYIADKIRNSNLGEQDDGLIYRDKDKNAKYYIRKWSDIINVDQKGRYKFLRDKLQADPQLYSGIVTNKIVESVT